MSTFRGIPAQVAAIALLGCLPGCAAIFKGNSDRVLLNTYPQGAYAWVDGIYAGQTPVRLRLTSDTDHQVVFRMQGYADQPVMISHEVGAGWVILDVLLTFLVGVIVDAATGAWFHLDSMFVALTPGASTIATPPAAPVDQGGCPPGFVNEGRPGEVPVCAQQPGYVPPAPGQPVMQPM